jgi:hypothetical protein
LTGEPPRRWLNQADLGDGQRGDGQRRDGQRGDGPTGDEQDEPRRWRREERPRREDRLRREGRELLKKAAAFCAQETGSLR